MPPRSANAQNWVCVPGEHWKHSSWDIEDKSNFHELWDYGCLFLGVRGCVQEWESGLSHRCFLCNFYNCPLTLCVWLWMEDVSCNKCKRTTGLPTASLSLPEWPAWWSPGDTVGRLPWEREPQMRAGQHLGSLPARHACWAISSLTPVSAGSCSGEGALSGAVTGSRLIIRFISLRLTRQGRLENAKAARQRSAGRLFIYFWGQLFQVSILIRRGSVGERPCTTVISLKAGEGKAFIHQSCWILSSGWSLSRQEQNQACHHRGARSRKSPAYGVKPGLPEAHSLIHSLAEVSLSSLYHWACFLLPCNKLSHWLKAHSISS